MTPSNFKEIIEKAKAEGRYVPDEEIELYKQNSKQND